MTTETIRDTAPVPAPLRLGDWVVAVREIVEREEGCPPVPKARPGELGQVVHLGAESWPTVMFESGATDCVPDIEVVRWSASDPTVSRRAGRA